MTKLKSTQRINPPHQSKYQGGIIAPLTIVITVFGAIATMCILYGF